MKPMLAANLTLDKFEKLRFPLIGSPKIDGIRVIIHPELGPVTRTLKPIPNKFIRDQLKNYAYYDGEIVVGGLTEYNVFNKTTSAVMSFEGEPNFHFYAFDNFKNPNEEYLKRIDLLQSSSICSILEYVKINNIEDLNYQETRYLNNGFEGLMLRCLNSIYKFNRSTLNEQYLIKLKRFTDDEAEIIGVEEKFKNNNERTINELGYSERSSHKENMIASNTLGALIVKSEKFEVEFKIGSGFDEEMRAKIWQWRHEAIGKTVKYKYQEVGVKDAPRFPIFLGFRLD